MKSTLKVLSIDFDFFIKDSDIQSMDTIEYKSKVWEERRKVCEDKKIKMEKLFPFEGPSFETFLSHFDFKKTPFLDVWDSHLDILNFLRDKKDLEICNVDSHHDISYYENLCNINLVDCGNWGGYLISRYKVKSWIQVYPEWRKTRPEKTFKAHVENAWAWETTITQKNLSEIQQFAPHILFVCRSSPWVPPIYDDKFEEFCKLIAKKGKFQTPQNFARFSRTEDVRLLKHGYLWNDWKPKKRIDEEEFKKLGLKNIVVGSNPSYVDKILGEKRRQGEIAWQPCSK